MVSAPVVRSTLPPTSSASGLMMQTLAIPAWNGVGGPAKQRGAATQLPAWFEQSASVVHAREVLLRQIFRGAGPRAQSAKPVPALAVNGSTLPPQASLLNVKVVPLLCCSAG